ncbi:MAG TPA: hypothetical protein VLB02_02255, partial [Candidatus Paceibacterota bacterium]|nr:hypothetical protein [Candidatus Paceibacterota bacterium]
MASSAQQKDSYNRDYLRQVEKYVSLLKEPFKNFPNNPMFEVHSVADMKDHEKKEGSLQILSKFEDAVVVVHFPDSPLGLGGYESNLNNRGLLL